MSSNESRLIADHQEVVRTLRLYDNITLINTSGDPIDEYDIEYKLRGYIIAANDKISISKNHRIKIKIPFGYPHFPPTIKPLSPIFHPEIDEKVVPIANYWEESRSLPNLILHIGNMICGNSYNLEAPFNLKAAKYYEEHQENLPLDSLSRIENKKEKVSREPLQLDFLKPLTFAIVLIALLAIAIGGGFFFYEKWKIDQAEQQLIQARTYLRQKDFRRARATAEEAMAQSDTFFVLRSRGTALTEEIDDFLKSKALVEGLQGKIRYGDVFLPTERVQKLEFIKDLIGEAQAYADEGELRKAVEAYENALEYATKHALNADKEAILHDVSRLKLQLLVASSEKAHAAKNWDWAIEKHTALLDFIAKYRDYLQNIKKQEAKTRHLLLIDKIALYSQLAAEAENRYDFKTALEYHNVLIDLIGKSSPKKNTTLHQTLIDSMQKAAVLTEKLHIERQRQWLLENFKDIFQAHYPAILPSTLRNPQALFVKYDEENMVFDLSCLEKGSGSVVRLRLFYEYNPNTQQWRVYDGTIEERS